MASCNKEVVRPGMIPLCRETTDPSLFSPNEKKKKIGKHGVIVLVDGTSRGSSPP